MKTLGKTKWMTLSKIRSSIREDMRVEDVVGSLRIQEDRIAKAGEERQTTNKKPSGLSTKRYE